ncbi:MAG: minor capsid protein [Clostridiaceae bacterium]|nr:minor capsid protein [Clostridiaceae bacterium]
MATTPNNPNAAYWQKRFKLIEQQANQTGANSLSYITEQYQKAAQELEAQVSVWYARLAQNNGVTMHEAKQLLSSGALKEFHWTVQEYIKYGQENALNGAWMQQLENASAKWHITKLEALQLQNHAVIESLFGAQYQSVSGALSSIYQSSYYHSCFEVQKGFGIGWNVAAIDENKLSAVLSTPWTLDGNTFSDRLWANKQKLIQTAQSTLTQGILTGKKPDKLIAELQAKMNASKSNAGRLVMTESAAMSAMGQRDAFSELDIEEFEVVETLDNITCDVCAAMDGQHFPMSEYEIGVTVPPFHPWCRGCTCPYFHDEFGIGSERIARAEDGTQYYVPGDTTYQEWKAAFVDGDKSGFDATVNDLSGLTSYKQLQPAPKSDIISGMKVQDVTNEYFRTAAPGQGTITYDEGYKIGSHQDEVQKAGWLHNTFGGNITLLTESTYRGVKMPDYIWRAKKWELKGAHSINGADKSLQHAIKQIQDNPGGVVLDILEELDMTALERQILGRFLRSKIDTLDVILLVNGKLQKIIRHKK